MQQQQMRQAGCVEFGHDATFVKDSQLAGVFSVTPCTIRRWSKTGAIPAPIAIGGRSVRWDLAAVLAHVKQHSRQEVVALREVRP
jgi:predicted DNA-binding transcriptional regulator AlpA